MKPSKKVLLLIPVVVIILGVAFWLLQHPKWPEVPQIYGATNMQVQKAANKRSRVITYNVANQSEPPNVTFNESIANLNLKSDLRYAGWSVDLVSQFPFDYEYIDTSKDINLFGWHLYNNSCPSLLMYKDMQQTAQGLEVTLTEAIGPCGWLDE